MKESQGSLLQHKIRLKEILATRLLLNGARLKCLSTLILVLVQEKSVNFVSLSLAFQGVAQPESSYRRIKRFFSEVSLAKASIAQVILSLLPPPPYTLCVDRTNWRFGRVDINILVIAVAHRGVAFPLVWSLLEKKGNSSSDERIDLLQDLLKLVKPQDIAFLLADREFIGVSWFNYLDKRRVPFAIRIRKDSLCESWCPVYTLFAHLKIGELKTLHHPYHLYGCSLRLAGMKIAANDYAIIATNRTPASAFSRLQTSLGN